MSHLHLASPSLDHSTPNTIPVTTAAGAMVLTTPILPYTPPPIQQPGEIPTF